MMSQKIKFVYISKEKPCPNLNILRTFKYAQRTALQQLSELLNELFSTSQYLLLARSGKEFYFILSPVEP